MSKRLKILELCEFSAGGCGVFARVKRESSLLRKLGYKVKIFSSNFEKGTNKIMPSKDSFEGVEITRFPAIKFGGESFMRWNFEEETRKFHPDIIIAHSYRHLHTTKALKFARKIKARVFLVTHAPFDRAESRSLFSRFSVWFYDTFIGSRILNNFDKVLTISNWELPYLKKLNIERDKLAYSPNGVDDLFFKTIKIKEQHKIIYTGRISPIKDIETIILSIPYINDKNIKIEFYGPAEKQYLNFLKKLSKSLKIENRIIFINKFYNASEQIKELDSAKLFILASKSEGMPQVLIEALARKKIVIASNNKGNTDIIQNEKNGFLFKIGNVKDLADKINLALSLKKHDLDNLKQNANKKAREFAWTNLIKKLDNLIQKA